MRLHLNSRDGDLDDGDLLGGLPHADLFFTNSKRGNPSRRQYLRSQRRDDPVLPTLRAVGEPVFEMDTNPTAEAIARLLFDAATAHHFPVVEVRLWETDSSVATYAPRGVLPC